MSIISSIYCLNVISDLLKRSIFYSILYDVVINKIKTVWKSLAVHFVTITKCLSFSSCAGVVAVIYCPSRVAAFCMGNFWAQQLIPVTQKKLASILVKNVFFFDEIQHLTRVNYSLKRVPLQQKNTRIYIHK